MSAIESIEYLNLTLLPAVAFFGSFSMKFRPQVFVNECKVGLVNEKAENQSLRVVVCTYMIINNKSN